MKKSYKKISDKVFCAEENFVDEADEFYIAVYVDSNGKEGLIAQIDLSHFPPIEKSLIGATIEDRDEIIKSAEKISNEGGLKVKIIRFSKREVIKEFPSNANH